MALIDLELYEKAKKINSKMTFEEWKAKREKALALNRGSTANLEFSPDGTLVNNKDRNLGEENRERLIYIHL